MKSTILFYTGLILSSFLSTVSPYTMDCAPPVVYTLANSEVLTTQKCDFELKYDLVASSANNKMTILYDTHNSTVTCPDGKTDSIHIAEIECKDKLMALDLYLPIVHLNGSGKVVEAMVNDQLISITL